MYGTGTESIAKGYILLMLGIPVYVYMRWRRSAQRPVPRVVETKKETPEVSQMERQKVEV
jgi:hypothetical protein